MRLRNLFRRTSRKTEYVAVTSIASVVGDQMQVRNILSFHDGTRAASVLQARIESEVRSNYCPDADRVEVYVHRIPKGVPHAESA